MGLSRKREKELKKLRGNTETLWQAHHEVLNRAKSVLREAKKQATQLAHDEVAPRVRLAVDQHVKPRMGRSARATQSVASSCHKKFVGDVLPSVAAVIGSTLSVIDLARSGRMRSDAGLPSKTGGEKKRPRFGAPQLTGSSIGGFARGWANRSYFWRDRSSRSRFCVVANVSRGRRVMGH